MKKKWMIRVLVLIMALASSNMLAGAAEFSDMPADWSTEALEHAVANGLLVGDDGQIRAGDNLTRAQMATIVNRSFGAVETASLNQYSDVSANAWYYVEMAKAVKMGTFVGSGDQLDPDRNITREEAFLVLARAFKLFGGPSSALNKFSDKANVSPWAVDGVSSLVVAGYVAGSDGQINPKQYITRAEFAQMMFNLLKNYVHAPGNYSNDFQGNVMVNSSGVVLKDLKINGDLILGEGVGAGTVTLDGVSVTGRTVIRSHEGSLAITGAAQDSSLLSIEDYFPMKENTEYIYEGIGNEYASYRSFVEYYDEDQIQMRVDNGGTVMAQVTQISNGKAERTFSEGETYHRENFLNSAGSDGETLLMEPLVAGTSWTLLDGRTRSISHTSKIVNTPSGSHVCIEVITEGEFGTVRDYYSKNIGLVKTIFTTGGEEVSSSLSMVKSGIPRVEQINFYYPDLDSGTYYFERREIHFPTNGVTGDILAAAYKILPAGVSGKVFPSGTQINRLSLNEDRIVEIDLNQAFLSEMNAGALYESMILTSIANTFAQYMGAEEVLLTLDGNLYASGHLELMEGETIKTDFSNTQEID